MRMVLYINYFLLFINGLLLKVFMSQGLSDRQVLLRQAQQGPKNQAKIMLPPALPNGGIEQKK